MSVVSQHRRQVVMLTATVTLMAGGCSHSARATPKPSPSPSETALPPSPSPTPDKAAVAASQAIAAYKATYGDVATAAARGSHTDPVLGAHAIGQAKTLLAQSAYFYVGQDIVPRGLPGLRITVATLALNADPQTAILKTCVDGRRQVLVDRKTGRPVSGFTAKPQPETDFLRVYAGRWMVEGIKTDPKHTC